MTRAHEQQVTVRFIERWPDHEPREQDPHYHLFVAARKRLKRQGLLKCVVDADAHYGQIELHHSKVEFAHVNDIDVEKFNALYGLQLNDEAFQQYVEQEGNLEPLCVQHHRGTSGVHSLPEPEWVTLRVSRDDRPIVMAESNSLIGVIGAQKTP